MAFASEVLFVFSHDVAFAFFDGMCATAPRILALVSVFVPYVDVCLDVLLGNRVETDDAAVEFEVLF